MGQKLCHSVFTTPFPRVHSHKHYSIANDSNPRIGPMGQQVGLRWEKGGSGPKPSRTLIDIELSRKDEEEQYSRGYTSFGGQQKYFWPEIFVTRPPSLPKGQAILRGPPQTLKTHSKLSHPQANRFAPVPVVERIPPAADTITTRRGRPVRPTPGYPQRHPPTVSGMVSTSPKQD